MRVQSCTLLCVANHIVMLLAQNPLAGTGQVGPRCCCCCAQTWSVWLAFQLRHQPMATSGCRWWIISKESAQLAQLSKFSQTRSAAETKSSQEQKQIGDLFPILACRWIPFQQLAEALPNPVALRPSVRLHSQGCD